MSGSPSNAAAAARPPEVPSPAGGAAHGPQAGTGAPEPAHGLTTGVAHRPAGPRESAGANRRWWDAEAADYQAEHGGFLGDADLLWCPEGLREADAHLLGDVSGRDVLEMGCGAAQGARWLVRAGARVTAFDVSGGQLAQARRLDARTGTPVRRLVQADAQVLPFRDAAFDVVASAFGAVPFVADSAGVAREVARVLRRGGLFVFSVTHPTRWVFRDDPGPDGLVVQQSYFDRTPYVEVDDTGAATYVEHHRTLGDRVRDLAGAGLVLEDLVEPEWPEGHDRVWGQWSPLRGRLLPGTAIFVSRRSA
ncbi:MAG: class I SAM-dependent methyltransferase [Actinomycetota bacterium]|nr:class I SAM-dependent methyltransferase [Actinomycetota bacterium]